MIPRYTRPEMGRVWSDENKFGKWLDVELAATEMLAENGLVPNEAAAAIRSRAKVDVARIQELEARVKHDVIAFTMAVGESIGDPAAARWLHYGMTSNDVVDTAQALQIREASKLIERNLVLFGEALDLRAHEFRHPPQIGRTHGVHAEPIATSRASVTPPDRWPWEKSPAPSAMLRTSVRKWKSASARSSG